MYHWTSIGLLNSQAYVVIAISQVLRAPILLPHHSPGVFLSSPFLIPSFPTIFLTCPRRQPALRHDDPRWRCRQSTVGMSPDRRDVARPAELIASPWNAAAVIGVRWEDRGNSRLSLIDHRPGRRGEGSCLRVKWMVMVKMVRRSQFIELWVKPTICSRKILLDDNASLSAVLN